MKKLIPVLFVFTLIFSACSKEKKLNKKLDGEWNVVTINGTPVSETDPELESITLSFVKAKENGTYTMTFLYIINGVSKPIEVSGSYTLTADEEIALTPTTSGAESYVFIVKSYSKTDLTLARSYNNYLYLLEKK